MTQQSVFAIIRQVLAIAGVVMGVVTASVTQLHLPPTVSAVLVVAGGIILAVEHYVADTSTGTPVATVVTTTTAPVPAPAPPPVPTAAEVAQAQATINAFSRSTAGHPVPA